MLRLRRVARLCSSTLSDTANRLLMRTDTEGSPSVAEEKSSAVPHFRSGRRSPIFAGLKNKGKVGVQRGRETAGVPSFLPLRRAPQSPALRRAQLPAEVQQKTPARQGRTACTVRVPRSAGAEKLPPVRDEPAYAVRVPRSAGAEKLPPVRGEPPAQFACPGQPVLKKLPPVRGEPPAQFAFPGQSVQDNR